MGKWRFNSALIVEMPTLHKMWEEPILAKE